MDGFKLYVTNTSTIPPDGYPCYNDMIGPPYPDITQTIPCNQFGKYVIYYDAQGSDEGSQIYQPVVGYVTLPLMVMMDACVFCRVSLTNGEEITQLREKGCNTVNRTSQTRNDTIVTTPGQKVHQKCRRDYINANSIKKDMREKDVSITGANS
ncbi:unnamed protein product [Mytilus edulis]|uniref:Uncharacterized protein n=1 Tax=Mytilus edulis TaxID=6550 RepID=A0A8S3ULV5_MYTED|nr:unnamed protein product [Mytilus edulis]